MYCVRNLDPDLVWVGADDRRLAMFEGVYAVPNGVSYNSYLLSDEEKTVLFDTVDKTVVRVFLENVRHALGGRTLDYLIVQHMEPDHSAALMQILALYPNAKVVCTARAADMIERFFGVDVKDRAMLVKEGDTLKTGRHELTFYMAPMVHWPEVMVTYDAFGKTLFSADAFGTFGALNGALFADEVDFFGDYLGEARRYYANIVGKYGSQVQALLKKAATLKIERICPLHGFVHRKNLGDYVEKYDRWSAYVPETTGVMVAYASIYGNTENACAALCCRLNDLGVQTTMLDVSVSPASDVVSAAFRYSHLVFAAPTYNAGIFVSMEAVLHDLAAHGVRNRTVAFLENGSWAPTSGKLMRQIFEPLKNITLIEPIVTIPSAPKEAERAQLETLALAIKASMPSDASNPQDAAIPHIAAEMDESALHSLTYGLFVLSARDGEKDNACIVNTVWQIADSPKRVAVSINKRNLTHDMVKKTGAFSASVLSEDAPMSVFERFGFQSGRTANKFDGFADTARGANGILYLTRYTNALLSCRVVAAADYGSHTLFIGELVEAKRLSQTPSVTYAYYFAHIKPKKPVSPASGGGWRCKICGYVYEGDTLPADFVCPVCKHGAADFERIEPPAPKKKRYVCKICGYEYEGDTLPADFVCPLCKHGADDFELVE